MPGIRGYLGAFRRSRRLPLRRPAPAAAGRPGLLAAECAVAISYNGLNQAVMMASPEDIEDFVRGFSLSSGFVESIDDI